MQISDKEKIRQSVRDSYGKIAKAGTIVGGISPAPSCCGPSEISTPGSSTASCCGGPEVAAGQISALMGYSKEDIQSVIEGANMGLGCGNPVALASLKPGETVVDLGSGGGFGLGNRRGLGLFRFGAGFGDLVVGFAHRLYPVATLSGGLATVIRSILRCRCIRPQSRASGRGGQPGT